LTQKGAELSNGKIISVLLSSIGAIVSGVQISKSKDIPKTGPADRHHGATMRQT
jgi:hypothetical protein